MNESGDFESVHARFRAFGQERVLHRAAELPANRREALLRQASALDLAEVERLWSERDDAHSESGAIEPPGEAVRELGDGVGDAERVAWRDAGRELVAAGRVAVVIAAGGQGTRLGFGAPKGLFPIGPRTERCLLSWIIGKVVHHARRHGVAIPVVLMVSEATEGALREAANLQDDFGLAPGLLQFARQASLPALDEDGRLLLAEPDRIAVSPNGHGGLYAALVDSGALDDLRARGISTLSYVQVDNPLVQPVDEEFLGLHATSGSELSSKSVGKASAAERVGVFARVDGRLRIVEYSELSDELAAATDDAGRLRFRHGSIAAHAIDVEFAARMAREGLPMHRAHKRVPYIDEEGRRVEPRGPNAYKFESFLFDAIPLAERAVVLEVERSEQFAPVKNAEGADSPATAAEALQAEFRRWHRAAGRLAPDGVIELDPEVHPDCDAFVRD